MGDSGAGRPAARAIAPPPTDDRDLSGARLTTARSEGAPAAVGHAVEADWASFATAPTLLLTPPDTSDVDDVASTSRIATTPPKATEEQPWFKSGTTLPPPTMRPMGDSVAPQPLRKLPNPRVLKAVSGVIAVCLLIVAVAGLKLLYKRIQTPAAGPTPSAESNSPKVATADLAQTPPSGVESAPAPEMARPASTAATSVQAESAPRAAVARPTPPRTSTKATPRRAPLPKKTGRGTH